MSSMKNTLLAIVTTLTFASCTDKKPELKDYNTNFSGYTYMQSKDAFFRSDSTGKVFSIESNAGNLAVDTTVTHKLLYGRGGKAVVMNSEMVNLATKIRHNQIRLNYLVDSAKYDSKHK